MDNNTTKKLQDATDRVHEEIIDDILIFGNTLLDLCLDYFDNHEYKEGSSREELYEICKNNPVRAKIADKINEYAGYPVDSDNKRLLASADYIIEKFIIAFIDANK